MLTLPSIRKEEMKKIKEAVVDAVGFDLVLLMVWVFDLVLLMVWGFDLVSLMLWVLFTVVDVVGFYLVHRLSWPRRGNSCAESKRGWSKRHSVYTSSSSNNGCPHPPDNTSSHSRNHQP
jgi:hypothetical protein